MKRGAAFDYGQKTKRDWRGWVWNRIEERLPVAARDAVVAGLFGREGFDLDEAIRRGFRRENLIGIERDPAAAQALRSRGVSVFEGEAVEFIRSWDERVRIDVLLLDLCGSFGERAKLLAEEVGASVALSRHACIAVNLLAGREQDRQRAAIVAEFCRAAGVDPTHRGAQFMAWSNAAQLRLAMLYAEQQRFPVELMIATQEAENARLFGKYAGTCSHFRYLSRVGKHARHRFDSVVYNRPVYFQLDELVPHYLADRESGRSIAAIRAWRTRRLAAS